jgi:predicted SAM-dependent methyltransferase
MNRLARLTRDVTERVDATLGTRIKPALGDIYRAGRRWLSPLRRRIDPVRIRARGRLSGSGQRVALHLGCGPKRLEGFINIDYWITDATDYVCDVRRLPWRDGSVDAIESHHVIEHISHRDVTETLLEWRRVLVPGGSLMLETPHFDETLREYLAGNEERLLSIFGRQRRAGDTHLFGYNPQRLARLLAQCGFEDFVEKSPRSHQSAEEPVFRLECRKTGP